MIIELVCPSKNRFPRATSGQGYAYTCPPFPETNIISSAFALPSWPLQNMNAAHGARCQGKTKHKAVNQTDKERKKPKVQGGERGMHTYLMDAHDRAVARFGIAREDKSRQERSFAPEVAVAAVV